MYMPLSARLRYSHLTFSEMLSLSLWEMADVRLSWKSVPGWLVSMPVSGA